MPKFKCLTRIQGLPQKGHLAMPGEIHDLPADFPGLSGLIEDGNLEPVAKTLASPSEPAQEPQTGGAPVDDAPTKAKPPKKK